MRRWDVPGGALAVVRDGRLVVAKGYGYADLAETRPTRPDDLFRVASVSKTITGVATLRALDLGLLDLDERAFVRLSGLRGALGSEDPALLEVRVRHLLHHTAGWTLYGYPDDPLHRSKEIARALGVASPPGPVDLVRWLAAQPIGRAPGSRFGYTNIAYVALGRVLEAASGRAYEDFVRGEVFARVGSERPRLGGVLRSERLEGEVEYQSFPDAIWESVFDGQSGPVSEPAYGGLNLSGLDASSAWVVSVVDLARLGAAIDGRTDFPDVLRPGSQALLLRSGTPPGEAPYGPGLFVATAAEASGAGLRPLAFGDHGGGMPGTTAYFAIWEDGVVVAAVFNSNHGGAFSDAIVEGLRRETGTVMDWPERDLFAEFR